MNQRIRDEMRYINFTFYFTQTYHLPSLYLPLSAPLLTFADAFKNVRQIQQRSGLWAHL